MKELITKVQDWAVNKGILDNGTPVKQALKTLEESSELLAAVVDDDRDALIDAIGDVAVTLIIQFFMHKDWPKIQLNQLTSEVNRHNVDYARMCVKFSSNMVAELHKKNWDQDAYENANVIIQCLNMICVANYLSLKECVQAAYDVISKRTGKMVNGQFVKDI